MKPDPFLHTHSNFCFKKGKMLKMSIFFLSRDAAYKLRMIQTFPSKIFWYRHDTQPLLVKPLSLPHKNSPQFFWTFCRCAPLVCIPLMLAKTVLFGFYLIFIWIILVCFFEPVWWPHSSTYLSICTWRIICQHIEVDLFSNIILIVAY